MTLVAPITSGEAEGESIEKSRMQYASLTQRDDKIVGGSKECPLKFEIQRVAVIPVASEVCLSYHTSNTMEW